MRIITGKYGVINPPKRLPAMYKTTAQFDYAVYRANMKNKEFMREFPTYRSFKATMRNTRDVIMEDEGITGPSKLSSRSLEVLGRSRAFMTAEEVGASTLYKEMEDLPDFKKIDWDDIRWDKDRKGYISNGYIITFNYGDEYGKKGLYNITPLVIE